MNWTAVISLLIKWGPTIAATIKQEEPTIQAFIKDVEAAFSGTAASPDLVSLFQQFLTALQGGTPPATAASQVLSGPNFQFPPQQVQQPVAKFP